MKKYGYSLIEVLMALTIVLIGVLPIMSAYPAIFSNNQRATEKEEGARLAMTMVDFIKSKGYKRIIQGSWAEVDVLDLDSDLDTSDTIITTYNTDGNPQLADNTIVLNNNAELAFSVGTTNVVRVYTFGDIVSGGNVIGTGSAAFNTDYRFMPELTLFSSKGLRLRDVQVRVTMRRVPLSVLDETGSPLKVLNSSGATVQDGGVDREFNLGEDFVSGRIEVFYESTINSGNIQPGTGRLLFDVLFMVIPIEN